MKSYKTNENRYLKICSEEARQPTFKSVEPSVFSAISHCRDFTTQKKVHFSQVFAGQDVGLREDEDGIWLVSFMDYDLGFFDHEGMRFEPMPISGPVENAEENRGSSWHLIRDSDAKPV
ncbi:MAG: hypothetical protein HYW49_08475 [Deltaproteobacteria bacterium]|nr:hypothetical protein [Deltaproteobacteria bacterium]